MKSSPRFGCVLLALLTLGLVGSVRADDLPAALPPLPTRTEALPTLEVRAATGESAAQLALGLSYLDPHQGKTNSAEAVRWLRLAAEQGDPDAQTRLGVMYFTGEGVPVSVREAQKWLALANGWAARQHFATAMTAGLAGARFPTH